MDNDIQAYQWVGVRDTVPTLCYANFAANYSSSFSYVVPQRDQPRLRCGRECILAPPGGEFVRPQGYLRQQRPRSSDQSYAGEFSRTKGQFTLNSSKSDISSR